MSLAAWSWTLTVVSIFGCWLTGRNPRVGWIFAVFNQQIWLTWAIVTSQWGFAVQSVAFSLVYARNLWRWRNGAPAAVVRRRGSSTAPQQGINGTIVGAGTAVD